MKRALLTICALALATAAHADPPQYTSIEDYKKVQPMVQYCWNVDHYEACPVGDVSGSTVNLGSIGTAATAANQTTANASLGSISSSASSLDGKTRNFCTSVPLGAAWNAAGSETDATATLTGICASGTCKRLIIRNWDTTNSVMVQFNSSTGTAGVCINPAIAAGQPTAIDSTDWIAPSVGVTNVYRTTTGTTSCPTAATVGAAHMDLIGCQ